MADKDLFGYGTGYVPQVDKIIEQVTNTIPDTVFDFIMTAVLEDAKAQGVDLNNPEDDEAQDILMETLGDVAHGWVAKVREAAESGDKDALHFMLLPF